MAERFGVGDKVVLLKAGADFDQVDVGKVFTILGLDPGDDLLYRLGDDTGNTDGWAAEDEIGLPPGSVFTHTVPAPPKFSSPEEADAWLEAQRAPKPPLMVTLPEGVDPAKVWLVTVQSPDGTVELQSGVQVKPGAPNPVRTALIHAYDALPT